MRTILISLAAAASALAFATPAAAQYYPQPQGPAYGYHNNNYGGVRSLQVRIDAIQRQIVHFDRRNIISDREARRLREDSRRLERQLRAASRYGLQPRERRDVEIRLARLEQRLFRDARDGNRWGRNDRGQGGYGYDRDGYDRDRDGRDDRYEDDRGRDHD